MKKRASTQRKRIEAPSASHRNTPDACPLPPGGCRWALAAVRMSNLYLEMTLRELSEKRSFSDTPLDWLKKPPCWSRHPGWRHGVAVWSTAAYFLGEQAAASDVSAAASSRRRRQNRSRTFSEGRCDDAILKLKVING